MIGAPGNAPLLLSTGKERTINPHITVIPREHQLQIRSENTRQAGDGGNVSMYFVGRIRARNPVRGAREATCRTWMLVQVMQGITFRLFDSLPVDVVQPLAI